MSLSRLLGDVIKSAAGCVLSRRKEGLLQEICPRYGRLWAFCLVGSELLTLLAAIMAPKREALR